MKRKALFAILSLCAAAGLAQPCPAPTDIHLTPAHVLNDLFGRYPTLDTPEVNRWLNEHGGVAEWEEVLQGFGVRQVLVRAGDDVNGIKFKAMLHHTGSTITQPQFVALAQLGSRAAELDRALRTIKPGERVNVAPRVLAGRLKWQAQVFSTPVAPPPSVAPSATVDEELASNEIHHPDHFKDVVVPAGASKFAKAKAVYDFVRNCYGFSQAPSPLMDAFTFADTLVRTNPQATPSGSGVCTAPMGLGLCDELSVVAVSYLRGLDVRARIRYLTSNGGDTHAFVEFQSDDSQWHHLDVVYGFDNPRVYCDRNLPQIRVMLAEKPSDARSTADCYHQPDPGNDSMLCPFGDFEVTPCPPGDFVAGYCDCPLPLLEKRRKLPRKLHRRH